MKDKKIIGIDLGGTNVRAGVVNSSRILKLESKPVNAMGTPEEVLDQIFSLIDSLGIKDFDGIGLGVPGPVDNEAGVVYELINIPKWKKESVREHFELRYSVPLRLQNDANCFALAEKFYGKGKTVSSFIGLIIGTGIAGGIILNDQLYAGPNGMAGEFGMMRYLDHNYEYYCSGQYFEHRYALSALEASEKALRGDSATLSMWKDFGQHLGHAIESILYAYDPEKIILGGSVSKAFSLYENWIHEVLDQFAFRSSIERFKLEVSGLEEPGVLGAAALHFLS